MNSEGISVQSVKSYDYDEVTEISGESLPHSYTSDDLQNKPEVSTGFVKTLEGQPETNISRAKDSPQESFRVIDLQEATMTAVEENEFEPELENKGMSELGDIGGAGGGQPMPLPHRASMSIDNDEDDEDDEDEDDGHNRAPEGAYDPADYEHLSVSPEISELFSYITRYTPQAIELEYRLRPYIPDYIPAVGDIDAFIKIPPPNGHSSLVGLEVLDEPSARQSDATVLDLQLRALARHTTAKSMSVKTVENAEKNGKVIEKWVRDISDLHRSKPPPTVHYSKSMPDIDALMQEWPGEVEELLKEINLPTAALEVDLADYVDIICATLDIPVYKSRIQSLHVLFTLYSVFKNSTHFRQLAEENYIENEDSTAEHLVIQ